MLCDILRNEKIEYFAYVPFDACRPGNTRLYSQTPEDSFAVFMLFPYYVENTAPGLSKFSAVYDYHGFAKALYEKCEKYLCEKYPMRFSRGYTDHSPFAEVDGACKAGLGVIGRNSLLINEKYASFVCIGELVTTLTKEELETEGISCGPLTLSYCEDCGACIRACPAHCCGKSDREECISAVTQKKHALTHEEEQAILLSGSVWGCDVCALACPHLTPVETPILWFRESAIRENAPAVIKDMDEETFKKYPFSWRKKEVILRNCEILKEKL